MGHLGIRAGWINPSAFTYRASRVVEFFQNAGLNTAYILQPGLEGGTAEDFGDMVDDLTAIGVECHVWIWCMTFIRADGGFDEEDTAAFVEDITDLLEDYPDLVGVHLDGIRYDKYDVSTDTGEYAHLPRVDQDKTDAVTYVVQQVRAATTGYVLSAAVQKASYQGSMSGGPYPNDGPPYFWTPEGLPFFRQVQQDPETWLDEGYVDYIVPMNYEVTLANWEYEKDWWEDNTDIEKIVQGVGWSSDTAGQYLITPEGAADRIDTLDGFAGYAVFQIIEPSYVESMESGLEAVLVYAEDSTMVYKDDANLVSYWPLNETSGTRYDEIGDNDLTDNNTVGYDTGVYSNAADFVQNNSEYLSIADGSQSGLDITGDMTICLWVSADELDDANGHVLVGKYTTGGNQRAYMVWLSIVSGSWYPACNISGNGTAYTTARADTAISTSTWYHIAVVHDGTDDEIRIYVDGSIDMTPEAHSAGIYNSSAEFRLGRHSESVWEFDGLLDEVMIFNRVLSGDEIYSIYENGILERVTAPKMHQYRLRRN